MIYSGIVSYFPDLGPANMVAIVQDELPHRTGKYGSTLRQDRHPKVLICSTVRTVEHRNSLPERARTPNSQQAFKAVLKNTRM